MDDSYWQKLLGVNSEQAAVIHQQQLANATPMTGPRINLCREAYEAALVAAERERIIAEFEKLAQGIGNDYENLLGQGLYEDGTVAPNAEDRAKAAAKSEDEDRLVALIAKLRGEPIY